MKRAPTGNRRGRPKATEVIARTNHRMDEFYRKKPVQSDAQMPLPNQEEEKKQEVPREEVLEYIDTSSNPHPQPMQQPAQMRDTGILRVQFVEESKKEACMTAKVDSPEMRRVQMA